MVTTTLTLSDFLLARIAEAEAIAAAVQMSGAMPTFQISTYPHDEHWSAPKVDEVFAPARVLAECESKRRIVRRCALVIDDDAGRDLYSDGWSGLRVAESDLRDLALPYADHPDYRPEWAA